MNELSKIKRVVSSIASNCVIDVTLVIDGSTGQNAFEQAKQFSETTNVNSLVVTKLDGSARGGVVIGISDQLKIPIKFVCLGSQLMTYKFLTRKFLLIHYLIIGEVRTKSTKKNSINVITLGCSKNI